MILKKFAFSFAFDLRKQKVTYFFFHLSNTKLCAKPLNQKTINIRNKENRNLYD